MKTFILTIIYKILNFWTFLELNAIFESLDALHFTSGPKNCNDIQGPREGETRDRGENGAQSISHQFFIFSKTFKIFSKWPKSL